LVNITPVGKLSIDNGMT